MKIHHIHLSPKDQRMIRDILHRGVYSTRVIDRARILLKADEGMKNTDIARHLDCTPVHVANVRQRFCTGGLQRALFDAPRSGKPVTFKGEHEAKIVAIACSQAPDGASRWTLKLLAAEAKKQGVVKTISSQSVWLILERQNTKPWLKKNVVHS